jgi:hypothetical protein
LIPPPRRATDYKKSQGKKVGTIPYGYHVDEDGETLIENATEQAVVATIHQYRHSGLSLRTIVSRLEERGFKARTGQPLQLTQVARIAKAPCDPRTEGGSWRCVLGSHTEIQSPGAGVLEAYGD